MIVSFVESYTSSFQENPQYEYQNFVSSLLSVYGHLFANYNIDTFDSFGKIPNLHIYGDLEFCTDYYIDEWYLRFCPSDGAKLILEYEGLVSYLVREM